MIRLLYSGDWHLRGTSPRNRVDDYKDTVKLKLREVFGLATKWNCKAIIVPGDIWDRPEVTIGVLLEFVAILKESPVAIYTTPGNHDIYGYNLETYNRSSLRLLELLVPQFTVVTDPTARQRFIEGDTKLEISFTPYSGKMDINGYGYNPEGQVENTSGVYRIHIAHAMLLDHTPPFDRFTLIHDAYTTADLVLTGHDHIGYGVYKRSDGKVFCNPGALMRIAASIGEVERKVQVAIIEVDAMEANIKLIQLRSAKPGDQVLDRSRIAAEKERAYAMDTFSALMQSKTGNAILLDINTIVEAIAAQENTAPNIVKIALELIDEQRAAVL